MYCFKGIILKINVPEQKNISDVIHSRKDANKKIFKLKKESGHISEEPTPVLKYLLETGEPERQQENQ